MPSDAVLNKALHKLFGVRKSGSDELNKLRSLFVRNHPSVFVERFRLARELTLKLSDPAHLPTDPEEAKLRAQQVADYAVLQADALVKSHSEAILRNIKSSGETKD